MKLLNEKKGLERWMLMTIIFAIFGFAIILWYIYITKPYTEVDREACAASIVLRSVPIVGEPLKASTPLNCRTEQIKVTKRDFKTEERIKWRIATAMAECWSMVGKGEMNFMPKDFLSEEYCLICSSIQFDEKTKKDFPIITGLVDYMNKTKMPGYQITYYDYIFGKEAVNKMSDFDIDTSNDYAVLFVLYKAGTFTPKIFNIIGGGVGLGLGLIFPPAGVAGAVIYTVAGYSGTSFLSFYSTSAGKSGFYLIPYKGNEIEKYCTRFENAP